MLGRAAVVVDQLRMFGWNTETEHRVASFMDAIYSLLLRNISFRTYHCHHA
jgi:hypothetical protein